MTNSLRTATYGSLERSSAATRRRASAWQYVGHVYSYAAAEGYIEQNNPKP